MITASSFDRLPNEILFLVIDKAIWLSKDPAFTYDRIKQVCKRWQSICFNNFTSKPITLTLDYTDAFWSEANPKSVCKFQISKTCYEFPLAFASLYRCLWLAKIETRPLLIAHRSSKIFFRIYFCFGENQTQKTNYQLEITIPEDFFKNFVGTRFARIAEDQKRVIEHFREKRVAMKQASKVIEVPSSHMDTTGTIITVSLWASLPLSFLTMGFFIYLSPKMIK